MPIESRTSHNVGVTRDRVILNTTLSALRVDFNIPVVMKLIVLDAYPSTIPTDQPIDRPASGLTIETNDEATNPRTIDLLHHPTNRVWLGSTKLRFNGLSKIRQPVDCAEYFTRHTSSSRGLDSAKHYADHGANHRR